jgi:HD-GYP domain-containing protein (c-di-GMP phosphodiesterase class II)
MLSHVLHLADRICVLFAGSEHILLQLPQVLARIQVREGSRFLPEAVAAVVRLAAREHVWLELNDREPLRYLRRETEFLAQDLAPPQVLQIAQIFSHVIDFRSRFTSTHSAGVAYTARLLGELNGMSSTECDMLLIAGYLHDLGKIAVDNDILEKAGQLSLQEYRIIRSHTFYTFRLLSQVKGMETIAEWAAYHHEKLDGTGYPFHLSEKSLPYGSRIMSVADVFSSITEDRPYRKGMPRQQAIGTLQTMVQNGTLSRELVEMLSANYDLFLHVREESQRQALAAYEEFAQLTQNTYPLPDMEGQAIPS